MNEQIANQAIGCKITSNGHECEILRWDKFGGEIHWAVMLPDGSCGWIHWKLAGQPVW